MSRLIIVRDNEGLFYGLEFVCPGCSRALGDHYTHMVAPESYTEVESPGIWKTRWKWNGSLDLPTFTPSILVTTKRNKEKYTCHSFVENGCIRFLNDCTHSLKGQIVDLPEYGPHL